MIEATELIALETHGEWYLAQFAIDGKLCEAFWVHKSIRDDERCRTEDGFMSYLIREAHAMLDDFGDLQRRGPMEWQTVRFA